MRIEVRIEQAGYGTRVVVRGAALTAETGSVALLVGPNGSGKTTILRTIVGLVSDARGSITIGDTSGPISPGRLPESVALVPQGGRVFEEMSVLDNLLVAAVRCRPAARSRRLHEALSLFPSLRKMLTRNAGVLSGGERQQLGIARALMRDPQVLLLDEPLASLSERVVEHVLQILRDLAQGGRAVLFTEQRVTRALGVADVVYGLRNGQISVAGTAEQFAGTDAIESLFFD